MTCHDAVIAPRQRAREIIIIAWIIGINRQNQIGLGVLLNGFAVQENLAFAQGNRVTGQADDAFDPVLIFALWRQNNNIATGWHFPPDPRFALRKRDGQRVYFLAQHQPVKYHDRIGNGGRHMAPAIRIFAHEQPVTHQQCRHHRYRRDIKRLCNETVKRKNGHQQPEHPFDFRPNSRCQAAFFRGWSGRDIGIDIVGGQTGHAFCDGNASIMTNACAHGWSSVSVR